jgi:hypothetical protein
MPRIFGVNHHPEIVDRHRQYMILQQKFARGEVTRTWYDERAEALSRFYPNEDSEKRIHLTSDYTFLLPLRFYLYREVRRRAEALGRPTWIHENAVIEATLEPLPAAAAGPA